MENTDAAYEVKYKILDREYSVVLTTKDAVDKCIKFIAERGRTWAIRHVRISNETGKIVSRGSKIHHDRDF